MLAGLAIRPALSARGGGVGPDEGGQTSRVGSLRTDTARLRQEVEQLRARLAQLSGQNAELLALVKDVSQWVERNQGFPNQFGRSAFDTQAEAFVAHAALQAVRALHKDAYGSCTHCRCQYPCPTVAAIESGRHQDHGEPRRWSWEGD